MIKVENLTISHRLNKINCHISQGKFVGIIGANGAGKSTLLKTIAGILPLSNKDTSGQIWLNNCKLNELNAQQRSHYLAYLAQNTQIHWDLCVYDVIALGLPYALPPQKERSKILAFSEKFSLTHLLDKPFQQLSGGEKTRVQLARCCIKETPLLLADEPIAALDPYYQLDIMQQLKSLTPEQTCVVVIHHLSLAYKFCDEIILLHQGQILAQGHTTQVLTQQNLAKAFKINVEIDPKRKEIFTLDKYEHI